MFKTASFLQPIKSFEAFPSETNDNSIQVELENTYFSTNGTKHFIVVATRSKPSHDSGIPTLVIILNIQLRSRFYCT